MPVAAPALVSLEEVKTHFGIPKADTLENAALNQLITEVSTAIETWCNRSFAAAIYTDFLAGNGTITLPVRHPPISIATLNGDYTDGSAVITNLATTEGRIVGEPVSGDGIASGAVIASIDSDTQVTLSVACTETKTSEPIVFGITVWWNDLGVWGEAPNAFPAHALLSFGNDYAVPPIGRDGYSSSGLLFSLNGVWDRPVWRMNGLLSPFLGVAGNVKAVYVGGWRTIPYDVKLAALTAIGRVRLGAQYGAAVRSFSYRGFSPSFTDGVKGGYLSEDVTRLLANYHLMAWG